MSVVVSPIIDCHQRLHVPPYVQIQFLEGMSEKILQGIHAAQSDIHKEKELKENEEVIVSLFGL